MSWTMPQARRDDWNDSISNLKCPPFEDKIVPGHDRGAAGVSWVIPRRARGRHLQGALRRARHQLPGRLRQADDLGEPLVDGLPRQPQRGLLNDLRCVIAKFMRGRAQALRQRSAHPLSAPQRWGVGRGGWRLPEGAAVSQGDGPIEVHRDMAWRLNAVLPSSTRAPSCRSTASARAGSPRMCPSSHSGPALLR